MTARGSLPIKVRIPGCEPVRRLSGTTDPKVRDRLTAMLHTLHEQGRDDLVNAVARGTLKPLQVYNLFRFRRLDELPHADELPAFTEVWPQWLEGTDYSDAHKDHFRKAFTALERLMPADASLADLVKALDTYRDRMRAYPRSVNMMKSHVQAFLKAQLGPRHHCYLQAVDTPKLRERPVLRKNPLTPNRLQQVVQDLGPRYGGNAWSMAITGMGWTEYIGRWEREGVGLRIHGTKTAGRDRLIPMVGLISRPQGCLFSFRQHLKEHGLTPYDLRRTFTGIMVEAGVPRPRRKAYMGHTADDITALYEHQEVVEYLTRDAERMQALLGLPAGGPLLAVVG
jgi:integrase